MNLADRGFTGSIPQLYEHYMVPLIFDPYAVDLAARAAALRPASLLEIAAGTGVLTRHLVAQLPAEASIIASDVNATMLDMAATLGTSRPVEWRLADAQDLPFDDESFDLVVCQFGAMFFPDRPVTQALAQAFPDDPPRFLARTPHGYHDIDLLRSELAAGGFEHPADIVTLPMRARAESPSGPALGYCQGTPLRNEIEARAPGRLPELTAHAAQAISARFGNGAIDTLIQAHVVIVGR
ncbi:MAG: class I SAM-dependent methyltransferase [Burkholderiales bacterium]|nr:class I SAM-dependent methyltransferase [Burkholderiales bacterium]